jgi:hypothetical protein
MIQAYTTVTYIKWVEVIRQKYCSLLEFPVTTDVHSLQPPPPPPRRGSVCMSVPPRFSLIPIRFQDLTRGAANNYYDFFDAR